ncbi:glycosyltransferase family 4 protein [Phaeacidiphilus oryzae]|uniref:glycosyltransferase family 4 protein n=1 Tax=Phaeacidiphilus oryzae TaxID=348818 RepID=UPI001F1DA609|nr:glycosyltransferase family 4 protein [Phaeacidiphilus oryzae]
MSHYYPPHLGGIEAVVSREAALLTRRGAEVTVLTSAPGGASGEPGTAWPGTGADAEAAGAAPRVVRVPAWNGVERRTGVPFPVLAPSVLTAAVRWARWADVVHIHDCLYVTSWAAGLAAALTRTPQLTTQHVGLVDHPSAAVVAVQRAVYGTAGRALLRRARTVFTLNAEVARFAEGYRARADRLRHLPNGVDTERFRPAAGPAERDAARTALGLPADGRPLVLFAGRLVPKKGFDLLLTARQKPGAGWDLVLAGGGDREALAAAARLPGVHCLGALPQERLAEAYRACDVFALPSVSEGFPLSVQEAMASGLPVATTDDPGYAPYRLDRSSISLLPRTPEAFRDELDRLAGDAGLRARMGGYSRRYAETAFSWEEHAEALLERYREAAGAGAVAVAVPGDG